MPRKLNVRIPYVVRTQLYSINVVQIKSAVGWKLRVFSFENSALARIARFDVQYENNWFSVGKGFL